MMKKWISWEMNDFVTATRQITNQTIKQKPKHNVWVFVLIEIAKMLYLSGISKLNVLPLIVSVALLSHPLVP